MTGKLTLTFLFTDIAGSTRRWEQQPEAMRTALARQDEILRGAIEGSGGWVFRTVGDALCAAFSTAPDALRAAVQAQQDLHSEAWELEEPLKVRIVLHTGEAEASGGDYVGASLNRLGRMLGVCHGGQTLMSMATEELVRDQLPENVSLLDLGQHHFRDLARPDRIFQVLIPGLPDRFPPLGSEVSYRHNLPIQLTALVGRQVELAGLLRQIAESRLLTLTGPGGTGKTRLALEAAHRVRPHYPDGVFMISLGPLQDPQLVPAAIAGELGVLESSGPILERLKGALAGRELLLILDNFEHLTVAAPVVSELLSAAPRLKVLVTSRERLRLQGERLYPVSPLSTPPTANEQAALGPDEAIKFSAVELFCKRVQSVQPSFELTLANAQAVGEICARLDGLPLAIELAAARLPLFDTPEALLGRLGSGLRLLRAGNRDLPARQHTLQATIEWSYRLLQPDEQKLFRRLSVFSGGCTLETAEAVWKRSADSGLDILDGLEALLDKSLLRQDAGLGDGPRFLMLKTIRDFARERLEESGETETFRLYHAEAFLALAQTAEPELTGPEQARWLERLEREHNNLRAALNWSRGANRQQLAMQLAVALTWFWHIHGHYSEGRRHLEAVLGAALSQSGEGEDPQLRSRALHGAGLLAYVQGDYDAARSYYEEGLEIARQAGFRRGAMIGLSGLGDVSTYQGEYSDSLAFYLQSLEIAEALDDPLGIVRALSGLGHASADHGDYPAAQSYFERSLATAEKTGDKRHIARALNGLGYVVADQGNPTSARSYFERSLAIGSEIGDKTRMAITLGNLGAVASDLSEYTQARSYYESGLAIADEIGDTSAAGIALVNLSETELCLGNYAAARSHNERALAIAEKTGEKRLAAITAYVTGEIERDVGNYATAQACLEQSLAEATAIKDRRMISIALNALGQVALYQGDPAAARSYQERSLEIAEALGEVRLSSLVLAGLGASYLQEGELAAAASFLQRSLAMAVEISEKRQIAVVLNYLGEVELEQGSSGEARSYLERSLAISREVGDKATAASSLRKLAALEAETAAGRAARLWGAAERLLEEIGGAVPPADLARLEQRLLKARREIGGDGFAAAAAEGRELSFEEAVNFALELFPGEQPVNAG